MWLLVREPNLSFLPPLKVVPQCPRHPANPASALHPYVDPRISSTCRGHADSHTGIPSHTTGAAGTRAAPCAHVPISATAWLQEISLQVSDAVNLVCSVACLCFDDRSGEITPLGQKGYQNYDIALWNYFTVNVAFLSSQRYFTQTLLKGSLSYINPFLLMHRIKCYIPPSTPAVHFVSKQQAATVHGQWCLSAAVNYDRLLQNRNRVQIHSVFCSLTSCSCIIDNTGLSDYYLYNFFLISYDCCCD